MIPRSKYVQAMSGAGRVSAKTEAKILDYIRSEECATTLGLGFVGKNDGINHSNYTFRVFCIKVASAGPWVGLPQTAMPHGG